MAKVMLIDGNSLLYRAFFALPTDLATASGQVTNAVYGFTSMLINLIKDHHPDQLVATFDRPEPTFRHEMVESYKAGRAETPDILRQQMGLARQLVEAMDIPLVDWPGYEADDVIATLATQAAARGDDVIVVTGDRDTYQLVEDPHIKVLYNKRGVSDYALYDEAGIEERTGVTPALYPQYAALRGDPSDNLPGVPGVGEKTAAKLINTYGNLDIIFEHLDELTPKLRSSLADAEAQVRANAAVTPLVRDVPVEIDAAQAAVGGWDLGELRRLFDFLEFSKTLWDRFMEATGADKGEAAAGTTPTSRLEVDVARIPSPAEAARILAGWRGAGADQAVAAAWSGREGSSALLGLAFVSVAGDGGFGQPVWVDGAWLDDPPVRAALDALLGPDGVRVSCHNAKALMRGLTARGVTFSNLELDPAIAAYLVDPAGDQYLLEDLAARYAGLELSPAGAAATGQLDLMAPAADPAEDAARRAAAVARLFENEAQRLAGLIEKRRAVTMRDRSAALLHIATAAAANYRREKQERGLLDYDDLIDKTLAMLDRVSSGWVHYKLDRGVDHVLIDEAQDTSPRQWDIVAHIISEFTAGEGAREVGEGRVLQDEARRPGLHELDDVVLSCEQAHHDDLGVRRQELHRTDCARTVVVG